MHLTRQRWCVTFSRTSGLKNWFLTALSSCVLFLYLILEKKKRCVKYVDVAMHTGQGENSRICWLIRNVLLPCVLKCKFWKAAWSELELDLWACPSASAPPAAPSSHSDVLEALEQRRAKYIEASNQAKANGDDRKARMHDRISKVTVDPRTLDCHVYIYTAFITVAFKGLATLIKSLTGIKLTTKHFSLFWVISVYGFCFVQFYKMEKIAPWNSDVQTFACVCIDVSFNSAVNGMVFTHVIYLHTNNNMPHLWHIKNVCAGLFLFI